VLLAATRERVQIGSPLERVSPGAKYLITFALSANPFTVGLLESSAPGKTLRVSAAGQAEDFSYDVSSKGNSAANMKYESHDFSFIANSTQTTLALFSTMPARVSGPVIDDVFVSKVASIPEPQNFLFLSVGAVLLLLAVYRRASAC